jgi:hypothetical protein
MSRHIQKIDKGSGLSGMTTCEEYSIVRKASDWEDDGQDIDFFIVVV